MNRKAYVKTVSKGLRCSKAREGEFVRDLEADIAEALAAGEAWDEVERRMGDPRQMASEFNEDLPASEVAAGKRRTRLRIAAIVAAVAVALIAIVAAAAWQVTLRQAPLEQSAVFSEQAVEQRAQDVVALVNAGDYQAIRDMLPASLPPEGLSDEVIKNARQTVGGDDWGAFVSFGNSYTSEVSQGGHAMALVDTVAVYENAVVTYTMSFNENMELTNFFMR